MDVPKSSCAIGWTVPFIHSCSFAASRQFTKLYEFMVDIAGILHLPALMQRALDLIFNTLRPIAR